MRRPAAPAAPATPTRRLPGDSSQDRLRWCYHCDTPHGSHPSTLVRPNRAPEVACPWCHAGPFEACHPVSRRPRRDQLTRTPGGCHPSRLEAVI